MLVILWLPFHSSSLIIPLSLIFIPSLQLLRPSSPLTTSTTLFLSPAIQASQIRSHHLQSNEMCFETEKRQLQRNQSSHQQFAGQEGQEETALFWVFLVLGILTLLVLARHMVIVTYWLRSPQCAAVKRSGPKDRRRAFFAYAASFPWRPSALRALWQSQAQQDNDIILRDVAPMEDSPNVNSPSGSLHSFDETVPATTPSEAYPTDPTPPEPSNAGSASSEHPEQGSSSNQESTDRQN